ncbi:hypothetical protein JQK87_04815 [Streptomyces sp. G44]|uniref:hypothetical protein n=1 Tax=Streptomyces sp. G44 TaxID=2807632 RepID=UPI001960FC15|nr:hypothetical protein [Streptomyces sp. G44]MBM7167740.1 hypothetical protein [Streptomyces sp. G44]
MSSVANANLVGAARNLALGYVRALTEEFERGFELRRSPRTSAWASDGAGGGGLRDQEHVEADPAAHEEGLDEHVDGMSGRINSTMGGAFTCARGLSPRQLAERMADHEPVEIRPAATLQEASSMADLAQVYCVGRIGQAGDWAFIWRAEPA